MGLSGKFALVTGGSRGIGRGIALKFAERGIRVAIHYYQNVDAANDTLSKVRKAGSDGFVVQADVVQSEEVSRMVERVKSEFGALDVFVSNARPETSKFFEEPFKISLEQWNTAFHSQATAFLVAARETAEFMRDGGRIIAITYGAGSRTGSLQPWVGMGSAKAALEALVRYFAVALARRGITVNAVSPGWIEDSVLNTLRTSPKGPLRTPSASVTKSYCRSRGGSGSCAADLVEDPIEHGIPPRKIRTPAACAGASSSSSRRRTTKSR